MNRSLLYRIYGKIERQIAPSLKYCQYFYEDTLMEMVRKETQWLDLGCGHQVLPPWREKEERDLVQKAKLVVGFDYDLPSLLKHRSIRCKVRGDISALPFGDDTFDLVTANMVVEHLANPDVQFREVHRILKPGGVFVFHTPNVNGYTTVAARIVPEFMKVGLIQVLDGRPAEDVFKTHYRANRESQIRRVARETGFEIVKIRFIVSTAKFAVVAPLAIFELFWIRLLMTRPFRSLRTNLIVTLAKPSGSPNLHLREVFPPRPHV
jgi:ubiquinone/menaquinone biosynthesis C-methylase UbiE